MKISMARRYVVPKQLALKMDGAKASHLYPAVRSELALEALKTERVGRSLRGKKTLLSLTLVSFCGGAFLA